MQTKLLKFNDTYINVNEIRKIKYTRTSTGIYTYCIYLTDNSKEEFSFPLGRSGEHDESNALINWINSCLLSYNSNTI